MQEDPPVDSGSSDGWCDDSTPPPRGRRLRRRFKLSAGATAERGERPRRGLADLPYELVLRICELHLQRMGLSLREVPPGTERMPLFGLRDTHRLRELETLLLIDISEAFEPARRLLFVELPLIDREAAQSALVELEADHETAEMVRSLWLGAGGEPADAATLAVFRSIIGICPRLAALHLDDGVPLRALGPLPASCTSLYGYNLDLLAAVRLARHRSH